MLILKANMDEMAHMKRAMHRFANIEFNNNKIILQIECLPIHERGEFLSKSHKQQVDGASTTLIYHVLH